MLNSDTARDYTYSAWLVYRTRTGKWAKRRAMPAITQGKDEVFATAAEADAEIARQRSLQSTIGDPFTRI